MTTGGNRFHSPPVELPSSNAQNFFEEAKITQAEENELRRKFGKFCTKVPDAEGDGDVFLTLDNFCRMLQYYECASVQHYEAYFHAIDRNRDDRLDFQEFFLGCCAADPSTVHILNSFTGYERSQYIFDFYDTNRSTSLEFDEFARLTADCLSMQNTDPNNEQVKNTAIEKARDLGALEESTPGVITFSTIKFKKFYEFIQNERLRGTSRLFRFYKSIIKSRGSHHSRRAQGSSIANAGNSTSTSGGGNQNAEASRHSHTAANTSADDGSATIGATMSHTADEEIVSDREDCEWHAHLLELDAAFDPEGDDSSNARGPEERPTPPPYLALLPPAPAPATRTDPEQPSSTDARSIAKKVLRTLSAPHFDGLLPGSVSDVDVAPFTLATAAQLRALCTAAVRLLEPEDMVLTSLQPPVKVFGALHGQLLDLLSYFRWHQAPLEDGDILYTTYVFLGDYADRGPYGLEVLTLLLSLKVAHPHRVALLRGHHENRHLNYHLGLRHECERRLGAEGSRVYEHLNRVFEHMSLAAIIGQHILALGPGTLPANLSRLDQLRRYKKPLVLPHASQLRSSQPADRMAEQVLIELFTPGSLLPREASSVREPTAEQVGLFCSQHRLAAVVRSRQVPQKGFSFDCGGRLITITSCLNYCDAWCGNDASILCITKEENAQNLHVRPKVLTAQVAKTYQVLGRAFRGGSGSVRAAALRWPHPQARDVTPGRLASDASSFGDAAGENLGDAAALLVSHDRTVAAAPDVVLGLFPAYGPGRPPGGLIPRERDGGRGGTASSGFVAADGREDWAMLGVAGGGSTATRTPGLNLNDRQSLGARRSAGTGAKVGHDASQDPKRGGYPAGKTLDPIVTSVVRGDDSDAGAGATPKRGISSPERRAFPAGTATSRAASGVVPASTSGQTSPNAVAVPMSTKTHPEAGTRRTGSAAGGTPTGDGAPRPGLGSLGVSGTAGTTSASMSTATAADRRDSKPASTGAVTPTGGRSTPASGGVLAGIDRRSGVTSGAGGSSGPGAQAANGGKAKEVTAQTLRGPSRPPATSASTSPKTSSTASASAAPAAAGQNARGAARRAGGDPAPVGAAVPQTVASRNDEGVPSSPGRSIVGNAGASGENVRGGSAEDDTRPPLEPQTLARLLEESAWLNAAALRVAPSVVVQGAHGSEPPLVLYLCRLWAEAGLSDRDWGQALSMFEGELDDQPRQSTMAKGGTPTAGASVTGSGDEQREARWTLETFSMWLLKRGRRLRECSQWFRAFDFDQDEMISISDFLQGLVAASAPHVANPNTPANLCTALALFRLHDLEKRKSIDVRELEAIFSDAQVPLSMEQQLTTSQIAQRATDFDFFRTSLLPRLQGASAFRLRVFAEQ